MAKYFLIIMFFITGISLGQAIQPKYEKMQGKIKSDSLTVYKLVFNDGSEINCNITSFDSIYVQFKALAGFSGSAKLSELEKIVKVKGTWENNKFSKINPHETRLLLSPTGKNLSAGSVYFSSSEIFFWMLSIAPTNFFTFGIGLPIIYSFRFNTFYGYVKFHIIDYMGFDISAGSLGILYDSNFEYAPFEVITYSGNKFSITTGLYNNINHSSILFVGGEIKLSNRSSIVTENWIIPESEINLYSFAIRYKGDNFSSDIGFFNAWEVRNGFPFMPWISLNYSF